MTNCLIEMKLRKILTAEGLPKLSEAQITYLIQKIHKTYITAGFYEAIPFRENHLN